MSLILVLCMVDFFQLSTLYFFFSFALPLADCLPPLVPDSDHKTQQPQVDHGADVIITCDGGYSTGTDPTQTLTCEDGTFTPDPEPCLGK